MQRNPEELNRWLRAEAAGRHAEADLACRKTFLGLPPVLLPAGMKERIVSAILEDLPQRKDPFLRPIVRFVIAASLVTTALAAGWLTGMVAGAGSRLQVGHVIDLLQSTTSAFSSLAASTAGLWNQVIDFTQLSAGAAGSPVFLICFSALAGIALATFRLLSDLITRQKGLSHVDAI